jgi:hypothetical protein
VEEFEKGFKSAKFSDFPEKEMERLRKIIDMTATDTLDTREFIAAKKHKKKILTEFNLKK